MNKFLKKLSILCLIILLLGIYNSNAQVYSQLKLEINLFEYPNFDYAAKTVSNSTYPIYNNLSAKDYFKGYINPSMEQSIAASSSFYNSMYYGLSKIHINWFKHDFWNYLTESVISTSAIYVSEYVPLGDAWLHEEFHRAVLTNNFVNSYNEVNNFPFFKELISVNNVTDEDLIHFKNSNPVDFVRLHAAGIEGEYMLIRNLQSNNLFYKQKLPYFLTNLIWTTNSFYYVYFCHRHGAEVTTNVVNSEDGDNIPIRDFTGLDFTAWVYDLFRPFEIYEERGIHPSGIGLNRYIKPSDLTHEEYLYLKKQGYLQLLNFASPMLLGIDNIPVNIKGNDYNFNFAVRHILTSFGYDISIDIFLKRNKLNLLTASHFYSSNNLSLPGFEASIIDYDLFSKNKFNILISGKSMIWLQPENLLFNDNSHKIGGLVEANLKFGLGKLYTFFNFSAKTEGWVAGNVYQNKNLSARFGLSWFL